MHIEQRDRAALIRGDLGQIITARKRSRSYLRLLTRWQRISGKTTNWRIIAVEMLEPFTVETDRGIMSGVAGDWLVTNHPEDDPGSDLWTISSERMTGTYEPEF